MLHSISSRLIVIFISVTVLVVLITSIIFLLLYSNSAYTDKEKLMTRCADQIANLVSDVISKPDHQTISFMDYSQLVGTVLDATLWIMDTDGVFMVTQTSYWPVYLQDLDKSEIDIIKTALNGTKSETRIFSHIFRDQMMTVCVPVYAMDESSKRQIVGAVLLHSSIERINETFRNAQNLLIIALVIAVCIAIIVAVAISIQFTKPLRAMSIVASQMARGNYNVRTHITDKNELAELSYSLNYLAAALGSNITQLRNEKDKFSNIFDTISDGIAAFDINLKLTKYNTALLKLCKQKHFEDIQLRGAITHCIQTGERQIIIIEDKDILRFTISRIQNGDIVDGCVVTVQDISQSERLEQLRREFVANVSHEFRTPLSIIKGSIEALIDGVVDSDEAKIEYYERIETESTALEHLVKDLLDTSRFKAGKIVLELQETDLTNILTNLTGSMLTIADAKSVLIQYNWKHLPLVMGDYDRLRQLFIIFIDNAIKFTPANGQVIISTYVENEMIKISIKDTGVGIKKEDIPFIFERFYKSDKSRGGSETGTGLGLSIANNIVELHNGYITVESEEGHGTEFLIYLPFIQEKKEIEENL